ncbi:MULTISPECIES: DedA family protein [unclassified Streptomyces]|uniref:DedA family protein n=1 Tax=unclassified Streptomyces TaxID=2593676 RepID=UPI0020333330|nr:MULTISPECIES: VTT domain-containing protein [unclassified Streptomyces]MCM2422485.1 VTT domain-containing protein [Streptomyces sp. RKAG293]MCM2425320.1 VTT domain-containing protein [Streptomyces sp. RKAG337]
MIRFLAETASSPTSQTTQQAVGYPTLFLLVVLGSLVPVIPTGALVSGAAVVAFHQTSPFALALVFGVAALAAFLGDVGLYWLGQRGIRSRNGSRWLHRLQSRADPDHLAKAQRQLDEHGVAVLVLSRLIPAGRIPVMVACLLGELPLRRFVRGDIAACLAWAAAYQLIGIVGGSLFPEPWQGVALAVGIAFLVALVPQVWRRAGRKAGPPGE